MKILIVTVYNSQNAGSFLQAYALQKVLKDEGHEVGFLKREDNGSHSLRVVLRKALKKALKLHLKQAMKEIRIWRIFEHLVNTYFTIYTLDSDYYSHTDFIVLGSDTIWNFDKSYFRRFASMYLGTQFRGKRVISYAASAANTSAETFKKTVEKCNGLDHLSSILVRDGHTKLLAESITSKDVRLVTDPTLLLTADEYKPLQKECVLNVPFLLVYYFGRIEKDLETAIIDYAKRKHLKIVSMPYVREWCDLSVHQAPHNMVTYFSCATAIVTNTFHGCAFSLINEKPFAVHDEGKKKISEFLSAYHETERLFSKCTEIETLLDVPNKGISSGIYDEIRQKSILLLKDGINNSNK